MRYRSIQGEVISPHVPRHEVQNYLAAPSLLLRSLKFSTTVRDKASILGVESLRTYLSDAVLRGDCIITADIEPCEPTDEGVPKSSCGEPYDDMMQAWLYGHAEITTMVIAATRLTALLDRKTMTILDVWKTEPIKKGGKG